MDALTDEAVGDVMDGLPKGSVTKFTEVFKLESTMHRSVQTSTTYCGGSPLSTILEILSRLLIFTTHSRPDTVGISLLGDVFIAVTSAGNQRIKLVFK